MNVNEHNSQIKLNERVTKYSKQYSIKFGMLSPSSVLFDRGISLKHSVQDKKQLQAFAFLVDFIISTEHEDMYAMEFESECLRKNVENNDDVFNKLAEDIVNKYLEIDTNKLQMSIEVYKAIASTIINSLCYLSKELLEELEVFTDKKESQYKETTFTTPIGKNSEVSKDRNEELIKIYADGFETYVLRGTEDPDTFNSLATQFLIDLGLAPKDGIITTDLMALAYAADAFKDVKNTKLLALEFENKCLNMGISKDAVIILAEQAMLTVFEDRSFKLTKEDILAMADVIYGLFGWPENKRNTKRITDSIQDDSRSCSSNLNMSICEATKKIEGYARRTETETMSSNLTTSMLCESNRLYGIASDESIKGSYLEAQNSDTSKQYRLCKLTPAILQVLQNIAREDGNFKTLFKFIECLRLIKEVNNYNEDSFLLGGHMNHMWLKHVPSNRILLNIVDFDQQKDFSEFESAMSIYANKNSSIVTKSTETKEPVESKKFESVEIVQSILNTALDYIASNTPPSRLNSVAGNTPRDKAFNLIMQDKIK